jgi:hypothetical protein
MRTPHDNELIITAAALAAIKGAISAGWPLQICELYEDSQLGPHFSSGPYGFYIRAWFLSGARRARGYRHCRAPPGPQRGFDIEMCRGLTRHERNSRIFRRRTVDNELPWCTLNCTRRTTCIIILLYIGLMCPKQAYTVVIILDCS